MELAKIFVELGIEPKVMTVLGNDDLGDQYYAHAADGYRYQQYNPVS